MRELRDLPADYARNYYAGWRTAIAGSGLDRADADGRTARPGWLDGYYDYAAGRSKWHTALTKDEL
jgi:hypothetical protein